MNQRLIDTIHLYAPDREIDFHSAKYLGETYGLKFNSEKELVEFKAEIDDYLKTFEPEKLKKIEVKLKIVDGGANVFTGNYTDFAGRS
jgi:hypothetical protein